MCIVARLPPIPGESDSAASVSTSASDELGALVQAEAAWLTSVSSLSLRSLVSPLLALSWKDPGVAHTLWISFFSLLWTTLGKDDQLALAKPLTTLLSREMHLRQAGLRLNCVQALLEGVAVSHPQPKLPAELVRYLGRTFNAWNVAVPLLESHVLLFPGDQRTFDALAELYRLLGEDDHLFGLCRSLGPQAVVYRHNGRLQAASHGQIQHGHRIAAARYRQP
jgi:transformation/transcription domain-associated protein